METLMRISGGRARGIPLQVPKGDAVRPATDALRQAVFSSLGARAAGARFLDLFAGSGSYGLEALSRGAAGGVFVEADARTAACLRRNLEAVSRSLGAGEPEARVVEADVESALRGGTISDRTDLVFIDPPYESIAEVGPKVFGLLRAALAKNDPLVILEAPGDLDFQAEGWERFKRLGKAGGRQPTACFFRLAASV
jgi:16S rRNA (guanine966-N2)-methyltransferase